MAIIKVSNMMCGKCVQRIEKALNEADITAKITLENKTVEVDDSLLEKTVSELDDIGFDCE